MKLVGIISTAVLSLTLGAAIPAYAQEQHDQQEDKDKAAQDKDKRAEPAKPAKPEEKKAQEEKNARPEEQKAQEERATKSEEKKAEQRPEQGKPEQRAGGRIPDDRYKAHFGREHTFRVSEGDYRNRRFESGGYSFGFVDPWPSNWLYTQNVFVVEIDGVYYLCNPAFPGVNVALSVTL